MRNIKIEFEANGKQTIKKEWYDFLFLFFLRERGNMRAKKGGGVVIRKMWGNKKKKDERKF